LAYMSFDFACSISSLSWPDSTRLPRWSMKDFGCKPSYLDIFHEPYLPNNSEQWVTSYIIGAIMLRLLDVNDL
jgi:hypothetical protein